MVVPPESLNEATEILRKFLLSEGKPDSIKWICQEDVTGYSPQITLLNYHDREEFYIKYYEYALKKVLGYVWLPAIFPVANHGVMSGVPWMKMKQINV
jgi:hypothetical protein